MKNETFSSKIIQSLWEAAVEPLLILDRESAILDSNPIACAELSLLPGQNLLERISEKENLQEALERAYVFGESRALDSLSIISSDGNLNEIHMQLSPVYGAENQIDFILASVNKKTKALELLEAAARLNDQRVEKLRKNLTTVTHELLEKTLQLAEQKNKVSTIINGMGEGLIGCDDQGNIVHLNQAALALLGKRDENIIGDSFVAHFPNIAKAIGFLFNSMESLEKRIVDISRDRKDLRVSVSPIFDEKKQRNDGFVLIIQDRSEQAELDRMRSDLISIVSHELRSPLTSIKGYVDLMMTGDLGIIPDGMKDYLSIVSSNANRLAALIDDMLDLSRIETGKLNMTFGKVEIKYLCDYVYLTLKPLAEQKRLNFTLQIEEGISVSGDLDRLQQALTNLVSNAIKYTANEGTVRILAQRSNGQIVIAVADTGMGISPENQKKLFQRFFRVKNEKTRNIGGTGLGLCIAKSIIEAHDGRIEIESEEGKGSRFIMELPAYNP